jgi:hypothetical protein
MRRVGCYVHVWLIRVRMVHGRVIAGPIATNVLI